MGRGESENVGQDGRGNGGVEGRDEVMVRQFPEFVVGMGEGRWRLEAGEVSIKAVRRE